MGFFSDYSNGGRGLYAASLIVAVPSPPPEITKAPKANVKGKARAVISSPTVLSLPDSVRERSDLIPTMSRASSSRSASLNPTSLTPRIPERRGSAMCSAPPSPSLSTASSSSPSLPPPSIPLPQLPTASAALAARKTLAILRPDSLPPTPPDSPRPPSLHSNYSAESDIFPAITSESFPRPATATVLRSRASFNCATPLHIHHELQKTLDISMKMLSRGLSLPLVYLVSIDLSSQPTTLKLLSAHGLPDQPPVFDASLHLRALRSAEGGLLYKNPKSAVERVLLGPSCYAGGIMVPVLEVRRRGYVLGGYTYDDREFNDQDLLYLQRFAEQLEVYVQKIGRT